MRSAVAAVLLLAPFPSLAQQAAPRFLYIYRDSLRTGVDSAYRVIEDDGAQICADFRCPNPYLALESLNGEPHEAWWLNGFATEADTARVAHAYATNRPLAEALGAIGQRKQPLIGTPIQGFAVFRPDLSRRAPWSVAGARFMIITVTRSRPPADGWVWQMADSTLYVFRPLKTRQHTDARAFAVRPTWSMPAPDWVLADRDFWKLAPTPRPRP